MPADLVTGAGRRGRRRLRRERRRRPGHRAARRPGRRPAARSSPTTAAAPATRSRPPAPPAPPGPTSTRSCPARPEGDRGVDRRPRRRDRLRLRRTSCPRPTRPTITPDDLKLLVDFLLTCAGNPTDQAALGGPPPRRSDPSATCVGSCLAGSLVVDDQGVTVTAAGRARGCGSPRRLPSRAALDAPWAGGSSVEITTSSSAGERFHAAERKSTPIAAACLGRRRRPGSWWSTSTWRRRDSTAPPRASPSERPRLTGRAQCVRARRAGPVDDEDRALEPWQRRASRP